ncbi:MAG: RNA-binding transcriptional accessory protein [Bacteroidetes bacterium]|jgi:uncharacterized protein|nr:RNA-binding transcriptional accessory protein [Bacteroidota bacterium]
MIDKISKHLQIKPNQINQVLALVEDGATIPFIARYRKDKTGGLDEVAITSIIQLHKEFTLLEDRRSFILKTLAEKGINDLQFIQKIQEADNLLTLEDLYAPFKSRKKTRADIAKENGLEPLANFIMKQQHASIHSVAAKYVSKNILSIEDALQGARDIISENISNDVDLKENLRKLFFQKSILTSKVVKSKTAEASKFKDYFDFSEIIKKMANHRFFAIKRGADEGYLRINVEPPIEDALYKMQRQLIKNKSESSEQILIALQDSYKRLIKPALENELINKIKSNADLEAMDVFTRNLRQLLLASPLSEKIILAIDPGYRTGCKVAVIDKNGNLLDTTVIYIHENSALENSKKTIHSLFSKHTFEAIAIGDGTAGRETEKFIKSLQLPVSVFLVNEDGASIYSASEIAREEFPDLDLTFRGAISIGRRLMDPLAELIKIDPKSIGVGQYQHDVNQSLLKEKLQQTVESCVNLVGVNLNTAGKTLLSYVSGIGPILAQNIVDYRSKNGAFQSRKELLNVPRLGAKAFQQSAGFLRIRDGHNILDNSGVHPESYAIVNRITSELNIDINQLIGNSLLDSLDINRFQDENHGTFTLKDIVAELKKPGLDPRSEATVFEFANVYSIDDLYEGLIIPGKVTNLTKFGAFVDIGIKQGGMIHISEIADKFIKDPSEILQLNQEVMVKVIGIDRERNRINLSMKQV